MTHDFSNPIPALDEWQNTLGWQPHPQQLACFEKLYAEILRGNQRLNLTRITDAADFWEKHLWDSLRGIQPWLERSSDSLQVIDVGTGGGFPGLPVAIACPDWHLTLLDATRKKIDFLATVITELELPQVKTLVDRAEQVGQQLQHRERYDLALIRAVASASVCAEYTLPLLKIGGVAVLYRGQWLADEALALQSAVKKLGGTVDRIEPFITPCSQSVRHCIYLKKNKPTRSEFPRAIGVPTQKPL